MLLVNPARITCAGYRSVRRNRYSGEVFTADPRSGKPERHVGKLFNGEIDCSVSDHSPCPPEMKAGNIMKAWGGIAGLQSCMDVMFDEAVQKRGMSLPMFGKLMATNAADIFGLQQKAVSPERCRLRLHSAE